MNPVALLMAGGTGGHIFPGLALAEGLRERGWTVHWLGAVPPSMESRLVPERNFEFHAIDFSGVRGKGWVRLLGLPQQLLRAWRQSWRILKNIRPQVVVGFGGYVSFPGACVARLQKIPVLLHEQNSVAGLSNRILSRIAKQTYCAFPEVLPGAIWVGNPLRREFFTQLPPQQRWASRNGPLRVLVVGGSLGAQMLNRTVPQALALLAPAARPKVLHQSGSRQIADLRAAYAQAGVEADLTPFIEDMPAAYANVDLVICRAGAGTVTELAAVGAAALLVPFPSAVDDHQTKNARFLSEKNAAWLCPQSEFTAEFLAERLRSLDHHTLLQAATRAYALRQCDAVHQMVSACLEVVQ